VIIGPSPRRPVVFALVLLDRAALPSGRSAGRAGQGVGATRVLHYQCADAVRSGALRILLPDYEPSPLPVHLIHAARGALPMKMRAFLDFASGRLRHRLERLGELDA
jgi:DNA-binding transcriptional LysR family regulator